MFIALRDLKFAKGRFALMGAVVFLLSMLMVLLTGLSSGLVDDNISGVAALPADHLAFGRESGVAFNRSVVDRAQWEGAARTPGVQAAAPIGNSLFNAQSYGDQAEAARAASEIETQGTSTTKGHALDLAMFGMEPGSFVVPAPTSGAALGSRPDGVLVSQGLVAKSGVKIGDTIVLDRVGTQVTVIGTTDAANYGHVPVVYAPLSLWQQVTFPTDRAGPSAPKTGRAPDLATLVALRADVGTDLAAMDSDLGLQTVTRTAAFAGSPGYKEETGTLTMIKCFLYLIGAMLVGAFFAVWTIQRQPEIALVKALGGSSRYLLKDALAQAAIVLGGATVLGVLVGRGFGFLIPNGAPFSFSTGSVAAAAFFVVVLGLLGATLSIRRITRVDPLLALGGAR